MAWGRRVLEWDPRKSWRLEHVLHLQSKSQRTGFSIVKVRIPAQALRRVWAWLWRYHEIPGLEETEETGFGVSWVLWEYRGKTKTGCIRHGSTWSNMIGPFTVFLILHTTVESWLRRRNNRSRVRPSNFETLNLKSNRCNFQELPIS